MSEEEKPESAEKVESTEQPVKKKRRWLRILMYLFAAFVLLLVGAYFYISSAAFIRGQVFSRVADKLNQQVTASEISFSPFSSIEIKNFVLGDDPFLKAGRIKVAYELIPMLSNKINVNEITFEDAEIDARFNVDGKLNILSKVVEEIKDEVEKKQGKKKKNKDKKKQDKSPIVLNINNINFKNLKIRYFKEFDRRDKENEVELVLSDFSFSLPTLKSGEEFSFELKTSLKCLAGDIVSDRSKPGFELKNGQLTVSGKSKLSADLKPELVKIDIKVEGLDAYNIGEKLPLEAIQVLTDIGLNGNKITINGINIADPANSNSSITLKGDIDAKSQDVDIEIGVNKVDSGLLDMALPVLTGSKPFRRWQESLKKTGDISGFGSTVVDFKGYIKGNPSTKINAEGNLSINNLPMAKLNPQKASIVPFHTSVIYAASYDKKQAELRKLEIKIDEDKRTMVSMNLENPVIFDIEQKKVVSEKDEEVSFLVRNFNIDYIKSFMGEKEREMVRSGSVTVACNLVSSEQGKSLYVDLKNFGATNISLKQGENTYLDNIAILSSSRFGISDLKKLSLEGMTFSLLLDGKENISMKAGGEINLDKITADVTISSLKVSEQVRNFVPEDLKKKFKLDNINLNSSGIIVSYTKENGMITAAGSVDSKGILLGGEQFAKDFRLSQNTSFDVTFDQQQNLAVKSLKVGLKADEMPAVDIDLNGSLNSTTKAMNFKFPAFKVSSAARSFLPPDLISKFKLERINLTAENLSVDMNEARIILKGALASKEIGLGGEMFNGNVSLTQNTAFDLTLMKNKDLDLRKLTLQVLTDGEDAVNFEAAGRVKPDSKSIQLTVKQLNVLPGTSRLMPAELIKKYKLKNLNLIGKRISINLVDGQAGQILAELKTENLELGGTAIKPVTISQSLSIDAGVDSAKQLDLKSFNFILKPSGINPVEVSATGKVDLNFKKADSKIIIDVPQSVDVKALLALLKKQKPAAETAKAEPVPGPAKEEKPAETASSAAETAPAKKATPIKLTVQTSVKELIFEKESIKNVQALAYIDGNKYTLKNAALQIGESIIQASGKFENEKNKVIYASVKSAGLFDLSPINELINANTDKHLGGKLEIERMELETSGKDDKEIINNLVATGQMFMQDIAVKGYGKSIPSYVSTPIEQVFGPDPDDINFASGKLKFGMKDKVLTLEECELTGDVMMVSPTGTIELGDNEYIVDLKFNTGFSGSKSLLFVTQKPALVALATEKSSDFKKFQVDFPYNSKFKKFTLAAPLEIKRTIKLKSDNPTASETVLGLNTVSADLMNAFFSGIAEKANLKELQAVMALGNGDITSGVGGLLEGLGKQEIDKLLNKDKKDDGKEEKKSGIGGLLDGIFGGDDKKKEPEMTDEKKKELEKKKAEEKKKEEEKKKINKEDDLIKGIENIFK